MAIIINVLKLCHNSVSGRKNRPSIKNIKKKMEISTACPVCGIHRSQLPATRRDHLLAHHVNELIDVVLRQFCSTTPSPTSSEGEEMSEDPSSGSQTAITEREPQNITWVLDALQASMSSFLKSKDKFKLPENYRGRDHTVRAKLIELASQDEPFLDLSQDIPEVTAPKLVTEALANVALSDDPLLQQYSRGQGHVRLVNVLSTLYSYVIGRKIDPLTEVITTAGAHEALYSAISGHVHPGEEVILIEPYFDCYEPMVKAAGGRSVFVPLKPRKTTGEIRSSDWVFDPSEMTAAFNEKTKAIIVNTPHKHLGKVFTRDELLFIGDLCKKWNVMVISDEVYEWMVFEPSRHIRMASLPGMWDLTVTIGSGGKMFSVTGWKIGWAYGPNRLIHNLQVVHQNNLDSINTPTQEALAHCLELELCRIHNENCYLTSLARELKPNRDFMASFFTQIGMVPTIPDAGFFMMVDWTPLESIVGMDVVTGGHKDYRFAEWLMKNHNILGIPLSTEFYSVPHKNLGESYIRFCYFKEKKALQKAEQILKAWVSGQESSMM